MRKKKKTEAPSEGWLLPYSDMMTLLLSLFIVLFAMAKINETKFQEIKTEFGTILSNRSTTSEAGKDVIKVKKSGANKKSILKSSAASSSVALTKREQMETQQLQSVEQKLNQIIKQTPELANNADVSLQSDGIHINMKSNVLFSTGSAALSDEAKNNLNALSSPLKQLSENPVVIAGYTDNVPYQGQNGKYQSNWDLSAARAIQVMQYYVNNNVISSSNVSIQAYAENDPRASNATAAGRAQNRRVEIIIQRINYTK
ncbi:OmpA/MotB family protein [Liquorilactobacillus vini]|uniref:Chemotaxis protein MotB n=1 Tax=Liquorilactobacillus vini DSM 20605 TaxID=1133569 RepID=A0A0A7RIM9_9LACO|nr:flagellar motor protein MotB [Liquorilactobacillus vini]AJA34449.1 chemotaxis protein MotB [Liquorilactobacillus vini DSM 20605]KRM84412.1 flagellar motor protein B [Liquorilactobacillus vini DSM 20605]